MTTKGVADVVFCLDASDSMGPCFQGVCGHVGDFIAGLKSHPQFAWDWHLDFLAHSASEEAGGYAFRAESLYHQNVILALYQEQNPGRFFTADVDQFRDRLASVPLTADEAPLVALDCCLDFPWREAKYTHRVIIMMTDEPFETGVFQEDQRMMVPTLIEKVQRLRVMLFLVAPESAVFNELASAEKSVYEVVDRAGDGLARVNFGQVLSEIGKSVSVFSQQAPKAEEVARGLFGQAFWTETEGTMSPHDRADQ
jgi:hypothetical protein